MSRQRAGREIPQRPTAECVPHPVPVAFANVNAVLRAGVGESNLFPPGFNRGPFACEANVITTTLRKRDTLQYLTLYPRNSECCLQHPDHQI